ncbi:MAG TPA: Crp/Fnr family transcriptional regulator [Thermoanaerobacterales bacterium]|nr:Crp/Fnr family transcriptional regulator [Thermoanaerobacterales bacterium]
MNDNCHLCKYDPDKSCITLVPIFSNLSPEEMIEIAQITISKNYHKGEMIYTAGHRGKRLFVIHKGKVKITRISESGKEQVIRILGPGDFMGELSLFSNSILTDNAEALEDSSICIIDGKPMKNLMAKYPNIPLKVLEEMSLRLEKVETLVEFLGIHNTEKRIIQTLIGLSDNHGVIELDISKKDLAAHMGMSQETLSRRLAQFQENGWIELVGHRKIIIHDFENFKAP